MTNPVRRFELSFISHCDVASRPDCSLSDLLHEAAVQIGPEIDLQALLAQPNPDPPPNTGLARFELLNQTNQSLEHIVELLTCQRYQPATLAETLLALIATPAYLQDVSSAAMGSPWSAEDGTRIPVLRCMEEKPFLSWTLDDPDFGLYGHYMFFARRI